MRGLRVGIDGRMLGPNPRGIARYTTEMCRALDLVLGNAEFFLYARRPVEAPVASSRWHVRVDLSGPGRWLPNSLWLALQAGRVAARDEIDVFWGTTGLLPLVRVPRRTVVTVYDLVYCVAPETTNRRSLWSARLFFERSVAKADAVVAISWGTAQRLKAKLGREAMAVAYPGVSPSCRPAANAEVASVRRRYGLSEPYLLSVATREPRKNLATLIRSVVALRREGLIGSRILVLAGGSGWKDAEIESEIWAAGKCIKELGYVPDEDLAGLYSGADAFVFPSLYEGFGMPVLEARACGARVIASDLPELREAGGAEGVYVPPTYEGIREGIVRALAMPRPPAIDATQYSWERGAASLAEVFRDLTRGAVLTGERTAVAAA